MKRYIRSSEKYNPYHGKKYSVVCGYDSYLTNDPYVAIRKWFQGQKKNPTDCAILAKYEADGIELAKVVTPELLEQMQEKYPQGYKLDWLYEYAQKFINGRAGKFLGEGDFGDQVPPFCYG